MTKNETDFAILVDLGRAHFFLPCYTSSSHHKFTDEATDEARMSIQSVFVTVLLFVF